VLSTSSKGQFQFPTPVTSTGLDRISSGTLLVFFRPSEWKSEWREWLCQGI